MTHLAQHLRVGFRSLRRARGFAVTAALTLALGIGLATAVFSAANTMLLRPLPVTNADRLVVVAGITQDGKNESFPLGLDGAADFARGSKALARAATFLYEGAPPVPVRDGEAVLRIRRSLVS